MPLEFTMRVHAAFGIASALSLSAAAAAQQSFGNLSYPSGSGSTEIPYQWSSGENDNTNFLFTNNQVNGSWLTVGLRASPYYTGENGFPSYVGNNTFQVQAGTTVPVANAPAGYDPNAPKWGFNWSISMDGNRSNSALTGLWWSMRITGPNSSGGTGNWGTQLGGMVNLGTDTQSYAKNAWQLGYNFFPLSSQNTPGVGVAGLWSGLQFSPNTLGDYQFTIDIRQGQYGAVVGSTTMTVSVVPAPGALALVGIAGIAAGGRRRR
jgi:hypothetical protein